MTRIEVVRALDARTIDALAEVLYDCVHGGASVSFMHPFPIGEARDYWSTLAPRVAAGAVTLLAARDSEGGRIIGTAQLVPVATPNQPHRADVSKVLVHREARGHGVATALMKAIEDEAVALGRNLLVLDTVTGGDAERLYSRLGWQVVGVIPNYALMPDGAFCDTTVLWKQLSADNSGQSTTHPSATG